MLNMPLWEWGLLFAGGYIAIMSLTRLMQAKRAELVEELSAEVQAAQARQQVAEKLVLCPQFLRAHQRRLQCKCLKASLSCSGKVRPATVVKGYPKEVLPSQTHLIVN